MSSFITVIVTVNFKGKVIIYKLLCLNNNLSEEQSSFVKSCFMIVILMMIMIINDSPGAYRLVLCATMQ